jgi:hypothetical protein
VLFLRIKQCETALAGGRLDEAFELAKADDVRAHRRGQDLVDGLVKALVERGRGHLAAGRISAARADCDKAARLGGNLADVGQLRFAVDRADAARRDRDGAHEHAIANARRLMAQGQFTVVHEVLGAVEGDGRVDAMRADVVSRKAAVERAVARATEALKRDDWQGAIDQVVRTRSLSPAAPEVRELSRRIARRVAEEVNELVETGRIDAAEIALDRSERLADTDVNLASLRRGVARCQAAAQCVRGGKFAEAQEILRGLGVVWPRAKWIETSIRNLTGVGEALEVVRSGPLGLVTSSQRMRSHEVTTLAGGHTPRLAMPKLSPQTSEPSSSEKFTLQVDGVGSFLVFRASLLKVGPVSGGARPDVGLMTDAGTPTVTIARSDDDYFLQSAVPVSVNDKAVRSKLLCDGDRIALGPRCRIAFRRPNAASASAVLEISGARLGRGDVRHVILMDREIILGDASSAHVWTRELKGPAVLLADGGRLSLKSEGRLVDVVAGEHVRVGSLGFVVTQG